jgi:hypothetical protein
LPLSFLLYVAIFYFKTKGKRISCIGATKENGELCEINQNKQYLVFFENKKKSVKHSKALKKNILILDELWDHVATLQFRRRFRGERFKIFHIP